MSIDSRYINQIQVIINIFSIINGKVKVLLFRRDEDPFRGYWTLPSNLLLVNESLEDCAGATVLEFVGLNDIYMEQCHMFSHIDRLPNERIVAASYIGLVDSKTIELKRESRNLYSEWFPIDEIPKTIYDYSEIIADSVCYLRKRMLNTSVLKYLFPSDFTMPELQLFYEQVLSKKLDRRNFRKKFINLGLLEDTGDMTGGNNGRPAHLYRFKEEIEVKNLF